MQNLIKQIFFLSKPTMIIKLIIIIIKLIEICIIRIEIGCLAKK